MYDDLIDRLIRIYTEENLYTGESLYWLLSNENKIKWNCNQYNKYNCRQNPINKTINQSSYEKYGQID